MEAVAQPAHGLDGARHLAVASEPLAQAHHAGVHRSVLAVLLASPDLLEKPLARPHAAAALHQAARQGEFARRQRARLAVHADELPFAPDDLGLGTSDLSCPPYLHGDSLASAGRDALTVAVEPARRGSLALDGNRFVAGYSEGGFAAAALQRSLQQAPLQALQLRGTMSIAGPLDLPAAVRSALVADPATGRGSGRSVYAAFTIWAYRRVCGDLYAKVTEVFDAPFADRLDALFDGTRTADEIGAALPAGSRTLLTPVVLAATLVESNRIAARVLGNDAIDVNPASPLISCHGTLDDTVPYSVTVAARARLSARGAVLTGPEQTGQGDDGAYAPCMLEAVRIFRQAASGPRSRSRR